MRLSKVQQETIDFCKAQIDEARKQFIDLKKVKKSELRQTMEIIDAQNGIVYTQGRKTWTIRNIGRQLRNWNRLWRFSFKSKNIKLLKIDKY